MTHPTNRNKMLGTVVIVITAVLWVFLQMDIEALWYSYWNLWPAFFTYLPTLFKIAVSILTVFSLCFGFMLLVLPVNGFDKN